MDTFFRTHKTDIQSNELCLLDVIFDRPARKIAFRDTVFASQWCMPSHGLSDKELDATFNSLEQRGLVYFEGQGSMETVSITDSGAIVWEEERAPDWTRFCSIRQPMELSERRVILSITAVTAAVRDEFLDLAVENPIRRKTTSISDPGLLRWKEFGTVYVGLLSFFERVNGVEGFKEFSQHQKMVEENRSWWSSAQELQRWVAQ